MEINGNAKLLRLIVGESDKVGHTPLYEVIIKTARDRHLAGATAWRGILGFGRTARMRTTKLLDLSSDLPMVIEIVDEEKKIDDFIPTLYELFEKADSGGLITMEKVEVIRYVHRTGERS
jgi:PII-like signaling protein